MNVTETDMGDLVRCIARRTLLHNGVRYEIGEEVALPSELAAMLAARGVVGPVTGAPTPATPHGRAHLIASAIIAVIEAGGDGLTGSGKPKIDALVDAGAPADVTAAERDAVTGDLLILGAAASDKNAAYLTPVPDAGPDTE